MADMILDNLPEYNSIEEIAKNNARIHELIVGIIETEYTDITKAATAKNLGITERYLYQVRDKYRKLIFDEVTKIKQLETDKREKPATAAKEFLAQHSLKLAVKLYSIAIRGSDREARQACKDALSIAGVAETVQDPPDFAKKMQNIMFNIFYPEEKKEKVIDADIVDKSQLSTKNKKEIDISKE